MATPINVGADARVLPRERAFDSTTALLADPYGFILKRCKRHGTDAFRARIMLRETICMTGPRAAELFYDGERFIRAGGAPEPVRATLFGKGGVQGLDGADHRHRKALFMAIGGPDRVTGLVRAMEEQWAAQATRWAGKPRIVLYPEAQELLTRAVCAWAGVPLAEGEVAKRTRELSALFDQAAASPHGHLWSRIARKRAESWAKDIIVQVRKARRTVPLGSVAHAVSTHRELNGDLLRPRIAAVELLNVLRPVVANSVFIVHAAHALHTFPAAREQVASDDAFLEPFVQEVRRFYPFFPAVAARTRTAFQWNGFDFPKGVRVMLDLHGTNRDPRKWDRPDEFRPERFVNRRPDPFAFIPQGGGDPGVTHRCPGEGITIEVMKLALRWLAQQLAYDVPQQDLRTDVQRQPALPRDRFIMANVRLRT